MHMYVCVYMYMCMCRVKSPDERSVGFGHTHNTFHNNQANLMQSSVKRSGYQFMRIFPYTDIASLPVLRNYILRLTPHVE